MRVQFLTLIAGLGVCASTAVRSEPKAETSYYCKTKISSGISFDDQQKEWVPTPFNPGKAFVLTLKYLGEKSKSYGGKYGDPMILKYDTYNITITDEGDNHQWSCIGKPPDWKVIEVAQDEDAIIRCRKYEGNEFSFNRKNNRFLEAYLHGYIEGDGHGDTPAVQAGVCTKIN